MNSEILEKLFRAELNRNGERWSKQYKSMNDRERLDYFGKILVRRLVSEESNRVLRAAKNKPDGETFTPDPDLAGTQGPLDGFTAGGGRRVIRSTKTF